MHVADVKRINTCAGQVLCEWRVGQSLVPSHENEAADAGQPLRLPAPPLLNLHPQRLGLPCRPRGHWVQHSIAAVGELRPACNERQCCGQRCRVSGAPPPGICHISCHGTASAIWCSAVNVQARTQQRGHLQVLVILFLNPANSDAHKSARDMIEALARVLFSLKSKARQMLTVWLSQLPPDVLGGRCIRPLQRHLTSYIEVTPPPLSPPETL